MGAGAGVYQCNIGALVDFYVAGRGYLVKDGRLQVDNPTALPDDPAADINDRAALHAAEFDLDRDSDETTGISYDTESPYEEAYDGDMAVDHPMFVAMMGGTQPNADGWMTPEGGFITKRRSDSAHRLA